MRRNLKRGKPKSKTSQGYPINSKVRDASKKYLEDKSQNLVIRQQL